MTHPKPLKSESLRADFEEWFAQSRSGKGAKSAATLLDKLPGGDYAQNSTQRHWWTWQEASRRTAAQAAPATQAVKPTTESADEKEALDLLVLLFEAYEEGPSCYEDPEEGTGFLGHAVRVEHEDFHRCAELLNRRRPVVDSATGQEAEPTPAASVERAMELADAYAAWFYQYTNFGGEDKRKRSESARLDLRAHLEKQHG